MNTKLSPLLLLALCAACTRQAPPEANLVPKERWADTMATALPTMLCQPQGFFRTCFDPEENACLDEAMRATKACLMKLQADIPATLSQPQDGESWGKKVGECAGNTMEVSLAARKKKDNPDCGDPAKWQQ